MKISSPSSAHKKFLEEKRYALMLLYLNGVVSVKHSRGECARISLAILFHILWFVTTITNFWCLTDFLYSVEIFNICTKAISLIIWWTVRCKKRDFRQLLRTLNNLTRQLNTQSSVSSKIFLKASPFLMIIITFFPAILWIVTSPEILNSCLFFWNKLQLDTVHTIVYFSLLAMQQYVNWCIPFAAGTFYIYYCKENIRIVKRIIEAFNNGDMDYQDVRKCYRIFVKNLVKFDSTSSLTIMLCLARCFLEFFRSLILYFHYSENVYKVKYIICATFYTVESSALFICIILFADRVQVESNALRKIILNYPDDCSSVQAWKTVEKYFQMFEDKSDIRLTVWKMVKLKKKLLLTTATSLLTYGIILHQFHQQSNQ